MKVYGKFQLRYAFLLPQLLQSEIHISPNNFFLDKIIPFRYNNNIPIWDIGKKSRNIFNVEGYFMFTNEEKIKNFDRISERFYNRNFGQISKSDMELLMFDIYMQKLLNDNKQDDDMIDYRKCSDYIISRNLGITQTRVRNLKIRNQLVYPIEFDWRRTFVELTKNAKYDTKGHRITIPISDPNLYYEIQNFIEEQGGYIEYTLNKRIFQIRAEYYIELILQLEQEPSRKKALQAIKEMVEKEKKIEKEFDGKHIGKSLIDCGINLQKVVETITGLISMGVNLINLIT